MPGERVKERSGAPRRARRTTIARPGVACVCACIAALLVGPAQAADLPRAAGMYPAAGPALALVDSKIEVAVRGPIAEVIVTQRFHNRADHATEATYIFPLPADAAVTAMSIQVGARTIRGAIERREEAQRRYETAIRQGTGAALLDQERPDVFTQTVAAIPARGYVEVTLRYDTLARYGGGAWELVLPLVVAPRFVPGVATARPTTGGGRAPDTDRAPDASRVTPPTAPGAGGATTVSIRFADKVADAISPTHELAVAGDKTTAAFTDPRTDHDAIVRWRATAPATGWVEAGPDGGYAAVIVEAPPAAPRKGALRCVLVLDRSAASLGDADAATRPFVRALLGALTAADRIALAGSDALGWSPPADVQRALEPIWAAPPASAFDLTRALAALRPEGAPVVLISGGLVADDAAAASAAKRLGVPVHVIGVGPAPARGLLGAIAAATGGTARFLVPGDDLGALARAAIVDVAAPAGAPLAVSWGTLAASDVVPGTMPRLGAGQAALVLARVRTAQAANGRADGALFAIEAQPAARAVAGATSAMGPLARRWGRERLDELLAGRAAPAVIAAHALRYGLVSPHTSLVAIGEEVVVQGGVKRSVAVPVAVPAGMRWQAVKKQTAVDLSVTVKEPAQLDETYTRNLPPARRTVVVTDEGSAKTGALAKQEPAAKKEPTAKKKRADEGERDQKTSALDRDRRPARTVTRKSAKPAEAPVTTRGAQRTGGGPAPDAAPPRPAAEPPVVTPTSPRVPPSPPPPPSPTAPRPDGAGAGVSGGDRPTSAAPEDAEDADGADDEAEARAKRKRDPADGERDAEEIEVAATTPTLDRDVTLSGSVMRAGSSELVMRTGRGRGLRVLPSLGGGAVFSDGRAAPMLSLSIRADVGGATMFGLSASLWIVAGPEVGADAQGQVLATFARRRLARWLELHGGAGLQFGAGIGPAAQLGLRFRLPPKPRAAAFLRYDGALLGDEGARAGQNAVTLGLDVSL